MVIRTKIWKELTAQKCMFFCTISKVISLKCAKTQLLGVIIQSCKQTKNHVHQKKNRWLKWFQISSSLLLPYKACLVAWLEYTATEIPLIIIKFNEQSSDWPLISAVLEKEKNKHNSSKTGSTPRCGETVRPDTEAERLCHRDVAMQLQAA